MKIKQPVGGFSKGYNGMTEINGKFSNMLMNYGILNLEAEKSFKYDEKLEKIVILLSGEIEARFGDQVVKVSRESCFDNSIWCLNIDENTDYELIGISEKSELALVSTENKLAFEIHKVQNNYKLLFNKAAQRHFQLYDAKGSLIQEDKKTNSEIIITLPKSGAYLLHAVESDKSAVIKLFND